MLYLAICVMSLGLRKTRMASPSRQSSCWVTWLSTLALLLPLVQITKQSLTPSTTVCRLMSFWMAKRRGNLAAFSPPCLGSMASFVLTVTALSCCGMPGARSWTCSTDCGLVKTYATAKEFYHWPVMKNDLKMVINK